MTVSQIHSVFNDSFTRCRLDPDFMNRFERYFFQSSPDIPKYFEGSDMRSVKQMVMGSLPFMMAAYSSPQVLDRLATKHREMMIPEALFQNWIDSILRAVEETDPRFDESVACAWSRVLEIGMEAFSGSAKGRKCS